MPGSPRGPTWQQPVITSEVTATERPELPSENPNSPAKSDRGRDSNRLRGDKKKTQSQLKRATDGFVSRLATNLSSYVQVLTWHQNRSGNFYRVLLSP